VFALRYAHEYYTPPIGGIDFKTEEEELPDYLDFAYVAFTIGMTFQVSDTEISKRPIRRAAIHHALLSYVFGTMILGISAPCSAGRRTRAASGSRRSCPSCGRARSGGRRRSS
jgi:uncharacterized membrane protein